MLLVCAVGAISSFIGMSLSISKEDGKGAVMWFVAAVMFLLLSVALTYYYAPTIGR